MFTGNFGLQILYINVLRIRNFTTVQFQKLSTFSFNLLYSGIKLKFYSLAVIIALLFYSAQSFSFRCISIHFFSTFSRKGKWYLSKVTKRDTKKWRADRRREILSWREHDRGLYSRDCMYKSINSQLIYKWEEKRYTCGCAPKKGLSTLNTASYLSNFWQWSFREHELLLLMRIWKVIFLRIYIFSICITFYFLKIFFLLHSFL